MLSSQSNFPVIGKTSQLMRTGKHLSPAMAYSYSSHLHQQSLRYAVLGAGFAGLSVAWHLLKHSPIELRVSIDVLDEVGIGGGASGVSGGLLHPYSPKVKPLWRAAECWEESLKLLNIAETAIRDKESSFKNGELAQTSYEFISRRRGILRPANSMKHMSIMNDNAQNSLAGCRIQSINEDAAQTLLPNICVPSNLAFHMPNAINIHPQAYLEALYVACEALARDVSSVGPGEKEINFHKKSIDNLFELEGKNAGNSNVLYTRYQYRQWEYDAIIVCLGARSSFLPELVGRLPLRTCRGVTAHFHLPENIREEIPEHSPSILSDAWLAIQNPRNLQVGSTWDWKSCNYSQKVSMEEASRALEELLPKASAVYPSLTEWVFHGATAGLRAMPPLTGNGSLPLLGRIDDFISKNHASKFWLFSGLGSRGLLYHAWLGKLMAQAVISCDEGVIPSEFTSWRSKLG